MYNGTVLDPVVLSILCDEGNSYRSLDQDTVSNAALAQSLQALSRRLLIRLEHSNRIRWAAPGSEPCIQRHGAVSTRDIRLFR